MPTTLSNLKRLAGIEIETLADYRCQGSLGVLYTSDVTSKRIFHPIKGAYDDVIARANSEDCSLSMTTDSNRSEDGNAFPKRTCIEFRSDPSDEANKELLGVVKAYSQWLTAQKTQLRASQFHNYKKPSRIEQTKRHYLSLGEFVTYYNNLNKSENALVITSPQIAFDPKESDHDFTFCFPEDAQWVLELHYEDLSTKQEPVFFAQYNMSLPIGCVFEPSVKNAFPIMNQHALIYDEKEVAADFNESRPHELFLEYEQANFAKAVRLADKFSKSIKLPAYALGARDFLRGLAYELSMISTSTAHLMELFQEDALWIGEQHKQTKLDEGLSVKCPTQTEVDAIAERLAHTLRKSIFPYFMKFTLAEFFNHLHPLEQELLRCLPKEKVKQFCANAIRIANAGLGNNKDHPTHFMIKYDSFIEIFDEFYEQTFLGAPVEEDLLAADPMGFLTDRFLPITNISTEQAIIPAAVIELRRPKQGGQKFKDLIKLESTFSSIHQSVLEDFFPIKKQSLIDLDQLQHARQQAKAQRQDPHTDYRTSECQQGVFAAVRARSTLGLFATKTRNKRKLDELSESISTQVKPSAIRIK